MWPNQQVRDQFISANVADCKTLLLFFCSFQFTDSSSWKAIVREKCPNTELLLVSTFLSVLFNPNTGKFVPERTSYLDTFQVVQRIYFPIGLLVQSVLFRESLQFSGNFEVIFFHNEVTWFCVASFVFSLRPIFRDFCFFPVWTYIRIEREDYVS